MKITGKSLAGLQASKADQIFWDDDLIGFGIRLRGAKRTFVAQYRTHGQTRRIKLGAVGTITAEQARAAAKRILASVALGNDPQAERQAADAFRALAPLYIDAKRRVVRRNTLREIERYLTGSYFASLHNHPLDKITRRDVATCVTKIEAANGAISAHRARTALSGYFAWAIGQGLIEANPVMGTNAPRNSEARARVLSDAEIADVWHSCGDDDFGRIVHLLLLTGCRRTELGNLKWAEIDFPKNTITIPAERSKNRREHTLSLPNIAMEVIRATPRIIGRPYVFGARGKSGFSNWAFGKAALDQRCSVTNWVLHDLRRTCATGMADLGIEPWVIEAALNHVSGHRAGVAGTYNRARYETQIRDALERWAEKVLRICAQLQRTA